MEVVSENVGSKRKREDSLEDPPKKTKILRIEKEVGTENCTPHVLSLLRSKDEIIKSREDQLKSKDEVIKSKNHLLSLFEEEAKRYKQKYREIKERLKHSNVTTVTTVLAKENKMDRLEKENIQLKNKNQELQKRDNDKKKIERKKTFVEEDYLKLKKDMNELKEYSYNLNKGNDTLKSSLERLEKQVGAQNKELRESKKRDAKMRESVLKVGIDLFMECKFRDALEVFNSFQYPPSYVYGFLIHCIAEGSIRDEKESGKCKQMILKHMNWFEKKAKNKKDPYSFFYSGVLHFYGIGFKRNYTKALENFMTSSSAHNNPVSNYFIGRCYQWGFGVVKDDIKRFEYFKKAFDTGFLIAGNDVGLCYSMGIGVQKNYLSAFTLYKEAADKGYPLAQWNTGLFYLYGKGTEVSIVSAKYYFQKAAEQGHQKAIEQLKRLDVDLTVE